MERGPRLKVSSDRLEKPGIEPATPGLQGKWLIHYTTAAPLSKLYQNMDFYSTSTYAHGQITATHEPTIYGILEDQNLLKKS